jgi:hypothetical protein
VDDCGAGGEPLSFRVGVEELDIVVGEAHTEFHTSILLMFLPE